MQSYIHIRGFRAQYCGQNLDKESHLPIKSLMAFAEPFGQDSELTIKFFVQCARLAVE